jgi:hypothetical protein
MLIPLVDVTPLMLLQGRLSSSTDGTGVSIQKFEGPAVVVVNAHNVSGTTPTFDCQLKECSTSGGTYTALPTVTAITQVTTVDSLQSLVIPDIGERMAFLQASSLLGGTTPVYDVAAILLAQAKRL